MGLSKYGVSRFIKGFLDLLTVRFLTRFRERPLHMLGGIGLSLFGLGALGMLSLALMWLDPANRPIGTRPLLFYSIALVARRSPARDHGNPGRARHRLQHSHRGCLQHCRADSVKRKPQLFPARESHAPAAFLTSRSLVDILGSFRKTGAVHGSPVRRRSIDGRFQVSLKQNPSRDGSWPSSSSSPRPRSRWATACASRRRWGPTTSPAGAPSGAFSSEGTYVIDECPWQIETQDKVLHEPKEASGRSPGKHFYSSKPALLPTLIAGILYPARMGHRRSRSIASSSRSASSAGPKSPTPTSPNKVKGVLETPKDPAKWPAYIFYFKPIIVLLNVIPYGIFLVLFARVAEPAGARRLDLVLLLDSRSVRHLSVALYADSEQPHSRGLERVLRGLRLPPHLGRTIAFRLGGSRPPGSSLPSPRPMSCPPSLCCRCSFACWSFAIPARRCFISSRPRSFRSAPSWPLNTRSSAS